MVQYFRPFLFAPKYFNDGFSLIFLRDKIYNVSMDLYCIDREGLSG